MPVPLPDPAQSGQLLLVGRDITPGQYRPALPGYWEIISLHGRTRDLPVSVWYENIRTPVNAGYKIAILAPSPNDEFELSWSGRVAFCPFNISLEGLQYTIDTLFSGITPIPPPIPDPFDPFDMDPDVSNVCTVTGTPGVEYSIEFFGEDPGYMGFDYQRAAGSSGTGTLLLVRNADPGIGARRDATLIEVRNTDAVLRTYNCGALEELGPGLRDGFIRTSSGWTVFTRLPTRLHIRNQPLRTAAPEWWRNTVVGGLYKFPLHALASDGRWIPVDDFDEPLHVLSPDGRTLIRDPSIPDYRVPDPYPPVWPVPNLWPLPPTGYLGDYTGLDGTAIGQELLPGTGVIWGKTFNGADPSGSLTDQSGQDYNDAHTGGIDWQANQAASQWDFRDADPSDLNQDPQRVRWYSEAVQAVDHDWIIYVRDRVCRSGSQAYIRVDVGVGSDYDDYFHASQPLLGDLQYHLYRCQPDATQTILTLNDHDGLIPFDAYHGGGVTDSLAAVSRSISSGGARFLLPITPTPGAITGVRLAVDAIPADYLAADPRGAPYLSSRAFIYAGMRVSLMFAQTMEDPSQWLYLKNDTTPDTYYVVG